MDEPGVQINGDTPEDNTQDSQYKTEPSEHDSDTESNTQSSDSKDNDEARDDEKEEDEEKSEESKKEPEVTYDDREVNESNLQKLHNDINYGIVLAFVDKFGQHFSFKEILFDQFETGLINIRTCNFDAC
jgi:hypothetical protein